MKVHFTPITKKKQQNNQPGGCLTLALDRTFFKDGRGNHRKNHRKTGKFYPKSGINSRGSLHNIGDEMPRVGRKELGRGIFFRAYLLEAEYNLSTTKVPIGSLRTNTSRRLLCGRDILPEPPRERRFHVFLQNFRMNCIRQFMRKSHWKIFMMNCLSMAQKIPRPSKFGKNLSARDLRLRFIVFLHEVRSRFLREP